MENKGTLDDSPKLLSLDSLNFDDGGLLKYRFLNALWKLSEEKCEFPDEVWEELLFSDLVPFSVQ